MFRRVAFILLLCPAWVLASTSAPAPPPAPAITGVVADPSGAIVPEAEIDLVESNGAVDGSSHSGGDGSFTVTPPHPGSFTLVISEPGFHTVKTPVAIAPAISASAVHAPNQTFAAPLHIVLPIAAVSTNVRVNADTSEDLTAPDDNHDSSVMTSNDLKSLPIFDNDYATAMSAFLDDSATATGGSGLIVDGVEANRATVSASAVQEVRINQDPYSAQYYWPGRGQMEIITKSAADHYHGQFNFFFRDSALNAQNALAPSKPFEQRRIYEGHVTGPIFFAPKSSFLATFNRAEEDLDSVVNATVAAHARQSHRRLPGQRARAHPRHRVQHPRRAPVRRPPLRLRAVQLRGLDRPEPGRGRTNPRRGRLQQPIPRRRHRGARRLHALRRAAQPVLHRRRARLQPATQNAAEAPRVNVAGDFIGGSAQNDSLGTEYNFRIYDMVTWTHGRHLSKPASASPTSNRRAFDDNTNALGTYTFGPTLAADGVTVLQTALQNYANNLPSGFSQNTGDVHFIYHQQEMGAFIQDQFKVNAPLLHHPRPPLRLAEFPRHPAPRLLAARLLRLGSRPRLQDSSFAAAAASITTASAPARCSTWSRYRERPPPLRHSLARSRRSCPPPAACPSPIAKPSPRSRPSPGRARAQRPNPLPDCSTASPSSANSARKPPASSASTPCAESTTFRSVDINAPTPQSGYTAAPQSRLRPLSARCSPPDSSRATASTSPIADASTNTSPASAATPGPITSPTPAASAGFPQNQYAPNDEWANASFDRRHRLGMYAMFNPEERAQPLRRHLRQHRDSPGPSSPEPTPTATDLFNTRPDGVARNTETLPDYT